MPLRVNAQGQMAVYLEEPYLQETLEYLKPYHTKLKFEQYILKSPFHYLWLGLKAWQTVQILIGRRIPWRLIRMSTVCPGLSVPILAINM